MFMSLLKQIKTAIARNKEAMGNADHRTLAAVATVGVIAFAFVPELAFAAGGPWDSGANAVLAIFTGGMTRTLAIIAVICCGIAAVAGKLSWDWAIKIIVGIVLIFGSTAIVDYVISASR